MKNTLPARDRFETRCVHAGVDKDPAYRSVTTPIYTSSNFALAEPGRIDGYFYGRLGNPTRDALQECLASLEGGAGASATSSGMAAISTVMALFPPGTHVVAGNDIYGGTHHLFVEILSSRGFSFSLVDMTDARNVERALRPDTRLIWIETPSNPLLRLTDIAAVCAIAKERGIMTVADNTFLSPCLQRPLEFGVDLVVHSTTKYLNGHSDVVGGAIIARDAKTAKRVDGLVGALGTNASPFDAWLVLRGIKTLPCRMQAHERNARAAAESLAARAEIERVYYPGLPSHPQHELARRQASGFGGMVSFDLRGGRRAAFRFVRSLRLIADAGSLGGVESLIEHPATMSHRTLSAAARRAAGIGDGLLRLSVGIEAAEDIVGDLRRGFEGLGSGES